jgi:SAM-dependent methyltransferase
VLDVGCGSSRIIADLPHAIGLDIRQNTLRWLARRRSRLVRATGARLPFADASLEAVIHSQVIEHLPDDPVILAECHRVLRPNGVLVLGTPDYARPLWWVLEWVHSRLMPGGHTRDHVTRFTRRSLTDRLTRAGFEVLACRYVGGCEMILTARRL